MLLQRAMPSLIRSRRTGRGRVRAWLRHALMHKYLADYFRALTERGDAFLACVLFIFELRLEQLDSSIAVFLSQMSASSLVSTTWKAPFCATRRRPPLWPGSCSRCMCSTTSSAFARLRRCRPRPPHPRSGTRALPPLPPRIRSTLLY